MNIRQFFVGRAMVFAILVLVLIIIGGLSTLTKYAFQQDQNVASSTPDSLSNNDDLDTEPAAPKSYVPYQGTLTGTQVCLSHRNTSGPQTLECAIGMKTDDGSEYALDFNAMPQGLGSIQNGTRFTASGLITPVENLSSDHWQKYNIKAIFSITKIESAPTLSPSTPSRPTPIKPTPTSPKESATGACYIGGCSAQLCTGEPDMASTCEYREEYACYQKATCERQATTGKCGWTKTPELSACLAK